MGCDIHLYVETKQDGKWVPADEWVHDDYGENGIGVDYDKAFYNGRNYALFSVLADVRNGHGFAGGDTGDRINPISPPRGLPDDVSTEIRTESEDFGSDGHSHSWLTVRELMDYDWTQIAVKRGWVDAVTYYQWRGEGRPYEYCGSVGGGSVKHLSNDEMDAAIAKIKVVADKNKETMKNIGNTLYDLIRRYMQHHYTQIEWREMYCELCANFLGVTLPRLWRLGSPEDVRIVFWFDN